MFPKSVARHILPWHSARCVYVWDGVDGDAATNPSELGVLWPLGRSRHVTAGWGVAGVGMCPVSPVGLPLRRECTYTLTARSRKEYTDAGSSLGGKLILGSARVDTKVWAPFPKTHSRPACALVGLCGLLVSFRELRWLRPHLPGRQAELIFCWSFGCEGRRNAA